MKKIFFLLILLSFPLAAGWKIKDAPYRLIFSPGKINEVNYLDLRILSLPEEAEKAFLCAKDGTALPLYRYDADHLLIPPRKDASLLELYFGKGKITGKNPPWPKNVKIPLNIRLKQRHFVEQYQDDPQNWKDIPVNGQRFSKFAQKKREYFLEQGKLAVSQMDFSCEHFLLRRKDDFSSVPFHAPSADSAVKKVLAQLAELTPLELEKHFFHRFTRMQDGENASRIFFTRRPIDTDKNLLTRFCGMLSIPEKGIYQFKVNTNSTRIVRIDGKTFVRKFGVFQSENSYETGSSDFFETELDEGVHFLEFLYYKGPIAIWAALSWRKKDSGEKYKLMQSDDFTPAAGVRLISCENRNGKKYPIVLRDDSLALYTAKRNPLLLDRFHVTLDKDQPWHWELNGEKLSSGIEVFALSGKYVLKVVPDQAGKYLPLQLKFKNRSGRKAPVKPELSLKLWMPHFLYQDEYAGLTLEIISSLPLRNTVLLKKHSSGPNPMFSDSLEEIPLEAMPMEHEDRFASSVVCKQSYRINAPDFREELKIQFDLSLPGLVFDTGKIRILPPGTPFPEKLIVTEAGLCDADNCRLLPLIRRTRLHEVRAWELPRKINDHLHSVKKLFVIAEDFPLFKENLEKFLLKKGILLEYHSWKTNSGITGSPALESLPELIPAIRRTDADACIIIPLSAQRRGILGDREDLNILALLSELLKEKENMRRITLTTPFPVTPAKEIELRKEEESFAEKLRMLRREKGLSFKELSLRIVNDPGWSRKVYEKDGVLSNIPHGLAEKSAEIMLEP